MIRGIVCSMCMCKYIQLNNINIGNECESRQSKLMIMTNAMNEGDDDKYDQEIEWK